MPNERNRPITGLGICSIVSADAPGSPWLRCRSAESQSVRLEVYGLPLLEASYAPKYPPASQLAPMNPEAFYGVFPAGISRSQTSAWRIMESATPANPPDSVIAPIPLPWGGPLVRGKRPRGPFCIGPDVDSRASTGDMCERVHPNGLHPYDGPRFATANPALRN